MKIGIIGTGYVGLVSGVCFAKYLKHDVVCVDVNTDKIDKLNNGECPIFEPGLTQLLKKEGDDVGTIRFSTSYEDLKDREMIIVAVCAPQSENGSTDLSYLLMCGTQLGLVMDSDIYVCIKSTVPVGSADKFKTAIVDALKDRGLDNEISVHVSSNPEFLKEGSAISDFMKPNRIVLGADDSESLTRLLNIYDNLLGEDGQKVPMLCTDVKSAQLIKYAANSFLATKISFANSLVSYCEENGINLFDVMKGIGLDERINPAFLNPGPGYGGSCFPKDVASLAYELKQNNVIGSTLLDAVQDTNVNARKWPFLKLIDNVYDPDMPEDPDSELVIGVLGAAFKAYTDDVRCSSTIYFIKDTLSFFKNCVIKVYDPIAADNLEKYFSDDPRISSKIVYVDTPYEASENADVMVLMTNWPEFLSINMNKIKCLMRGNLFLDTRGMFNQDYMKSMFNYYSLGKPHNK